MNFIDIPGQSVAHRGILSMVARNKFPHALLIAGNEGYGTLPFALAVASFLLCSNKQETDSCGRCANCGKTGKLEHADLHLTFPVYKEKSDSPALSRDWIKEFRLFVQNTPFGNQQEWMQTITADVKAGIISRAECDQILHNLYLASYEGGLKIQIIWQPELLKEQANLLLKMIEEPPANTIILFASDNMQRMLPTILSRTQIVKLAPAPVHDMADHLSRKLNISESEAYEIAGMVEGSYGEAIRLSQHTENNIFDAVRQWFNLFATGQTSGLLAFIDEWAKKPREQQRNLLSFTAHLFEAAWQLQHSPHSNFPAPAAVQAFVGKLAQRCFSVEVMQTISKHLGTTMRNIGQNAHSKTQLLALSLRLGYLIKNDFSLENRSSWIVADA
jgi:DNA polymerase-3 subunit delta'